MTYVKEMCMYKAMHEKQYSKEGLISSSLAANETSICRSKYKREKDLDFWWKESEFLIIANSSCMVL